MQNNDSVDLKFIIPALILLILLITYVCYRLICILKREYEMMTQKDCPVCPKQNQPNEELREEQLIEEETLPSLVPRVPSIDPIRQYDLAKTYDPLVQPARRIPRHELHPVHLRRMIDLPTRGYPDNFTQFGTLVKEGDPNQQNQNQVLRLFGRQEYPSSNRYEYYTMINSGLDQIKVPIETRRRELYDDDPVFIRELNQKYRVHLHNFDEPKYYPDIIW